MKTSKTVKKRNLHIHLILLSKLKSGAGGKHSTSKTKPRKKNVDLRTTETE